MIVEVTQRPSSQIKNPKSTIINHPLLCPKCQKEMRIVALIDESDVIERILRHLGLWAQGVRVSPARAPPEIVERVIEPWLDDPFPDYDTEPVMAYANE